MINFRFAITISLFLVTFFANAQQNPEKVLKNTSWVQQGYDRCLRIDDSTYTYYNVDHIGCKVLAEGKLSGRFKFVSLNKNELVLNPGGIVNYVFRKVDSLPPVYVNRNASTGSGSYADNFKVFWETFDRNYAFFKERNIDWKQVYEEYLPRVRKITSQKEFADVLMEIVKKIGDGHIRLEIPDSLRTKTVVKTPATVTRTKDEIIKDIQNKYLVNTKVYNNGVISWGKLKGSQTGYMLIKDMNDFADYVPQSLKQADFAKNYDKMKEAKAPLIQFDDEYKGVDQVMGKILADIGQADSIVIDLRFNGGGLETVALKLLSYFVAESKYVLSIQAKSVLGNTMKQEYILQPARSPYKGKVCLLLSAGTASAAEIFALAAIKYPDISIAGSKTAGIFSEILWKELPNGWEFSLSNEVYADPDGRSYEGIGIPVSYEMNYPRSRRDFYNSFYNGDYFADSALDQIITGK